MLGKNIYLRSVLFTGCHFQVTIKTVIDKRNLFFNNFFFLEKLVEILIRIVKGITPVFLLLSDLINRQSIWVCVFALVAICCVSSAVWAERWGSRHLRLHPHNSLSIGHQPKGTPSLHHWSPILQGNLSRERRTREAQSRDRPGRSRSLISSHVGLSRSQLAPLST